MKNRLIFSTGTCLALLFICLSTVSSRSIDGVSETEPLNTDSISGIPGILEFESGDGDDTTGTREKRTPRFIFRTVSCLFTFLINPSCLQNLMPGSGGGASGGGGGGPFSALFGGNRRQHSSSSSSSSSSSANSQPYYMISLPRFNDSDSNGTATEYPIYPIEQTSEYPEEQPSRPTNPILGLLQWKMNLIPNMLRRFFPGIGGGRRDDGGSVGIGGGNGGGGGLFSLLGGGGGGGGLLGGLGQGRFAGLLGGNRGIGGGGGGGLFGGLGGLGGGGGGGQY